MHVDRRCGLFGRCAHASDARQVACYDIQKSVQLFDIRGLEAGEYRRLVDFRELIQLVQQWLRGRRQVNTVRTPIARTLLPLEKAFLAETIDQSARRDLPDFERLRDDSLCRARLARNRCDQGPLGSRKTASLRGL